MKILLKITFNNVAAVRAFFISMGFTEAKNLVSSTTASDKFVIIETGSKSFSMFNKVDEEKVKGLKFDMTRFKLGPLSLRFFYQFVSNIQLYDFSVALKNTTTSVITISAISAELKPMTLDQSIWYEISDQTFLTEGPYVLPYDAEIKLIDPDFLGKKSAIAILELNYAFCDSTDKHSRNMFASMEIFSSPLLEELLFAKIDVLVQEFEEDNLQEHILDELTSPAFNKKIKSLIGEDIELTLVGLRGQSGKVVWITLKQILQYMDMSEEIFFSCLENLSDKTLEESYEIPGLEEFTNRQVYNIQLYLENGTYLFNFANVVTMKHPCLNIEKNVYETVSEYDFSV